MRGPGAFFRYIRLLIQAGGARPEPVAACGRRDRHSGVGAALASRAADIQVQVEAHLELRADRATRHARLSHQRDHPFGRSALRKIPRDRRTELAAVEQAKRAGTPAERIYSAASRSTSAAAGGEARAVPADPPDEKVYRVMIGQSRSSGEERDRHDRRVQDLQFLMQARAAHSAQIRDRYPDDVRIRFKHNPCPFTRARSRCAALDRSAGPERRAVFGKASKRVRLRPELEDEHLLKVARELGLNEARARRRSFARRIPEFRAGSGPRCFQARAHALLHQRQTHLRRAPLESFTSLIEPSGESPQMMAKKNCRALASTTRS